MLAYLDALIEALAVRDSATIRRLLAHPLARILTDEARGEAQGFLDGAFDALAAPLRVMQLRHQTAQLLLESSLPIADRAEVVEAPLVRVPLTGPRAMPSRPERRPVRAQQMELSFSA